MRISLDQHGGFAGIPMRRQVDTATLSADEAASLEALVKRADVFTRDDSPSPPFQRHGFDMQRYRLVVEDGDRTRTLHLEDGSMPEEVKPLMAYLHRLRPSTAG